MEDQQSLGALVDAPLQQDIAAKGDPKPGVDLLMVKIKVNNRILEVAE